MPRQCPRCKNSLGDESICANCGLALPASPLRRAGRGHDQRAKWQQTPAGKILIGLLLSAGIFYGLMQLFSAILVAAMGDQARQEWLDSFAGLILLQGLQALGLLVGGMMAGAGQRRGALYGCIVGVYNALLFLLLYVLILKHELSLAGLIVAPLLQVAFGTIGGYLGNVIWNPIQTVTAATAQAEQARAARPASLRRRSASIFGGSISWFRVLLGTTVAVIGTLGASTMFTSSVRLIETQNPEGRIERPEQALFLTWEISVLAMLGGGAIAGSNSKNGFKQGMVMGTLTCLVLSCIYVWQVSRGGDSSAPPTQTLGFFLFGFRDTVLIQRIFFTVLSVMPLGLGGGWFGSQLLPPLYVGPTRRPYGF
jgi:hypothetical protein